MPNFFDAYSPFLNHPLLTPERSASEVEQLIPLLGVAPPGRILDLGCGFGRHTTEFAIRGFRVTGIDPSATMIAAADRRTIAAEANDVELHTDLTATTGQFDAAVAMFTTIGQVGADDQSNEHMLGEVANRLRPGSHFVVEVPQRDATIRQLITHDQFGSGDNQTQIERRFDESTNRVDETFRVVADGIERTFDLTYRLFDRPELQRLLVDAGFETISFSSSLDGGPLGADDPTMISIAQRL